MPLWTPSTRAAVPTIAAFPTLNSFQFQINGAHGSLTIGPGTGYAIQEIQGLGDLPPMRFTDLAKPRSTGEFMGFDYVAGRDVIIKLWVSSQYAGGTPIQTLLQNLANVTVPAPYTEYPLYFNIPNLAATMALICRPRKKTSSWTPNWANSGVAEVILEFHATDPRCYTAGATPVNINFSASLGTVVYPFTAPITYTGTQVTGSKTNNGNVPAPALIRFTALSTQAFLVNTTTDQGLVLWAPAGTAGTLASGDVLWIDTEAKSVVYWPSGATAGQTQRGWLEPGSEWFNVAVGVNSFKIGSATSSGGAQCSIWAPDAYIL